MPKKFKLIAVGGTFDRLHLGHQTFLRKAFAISEKVLLGVTDDIFIHKKALKKEILPYQKRRADLIKFLKKNNFFSRTVLYKLEDVFGPTLDKNLKIEGILVTEKTLQGAKIVNQKRKELGLPSLKIIKAPLVKKQNGEVLSSTRIRQSLLLPNALRPFLQKPFGKLIVGQGSNLQVAARVAQKIIKKEKPIFVITVGDVVTRSFNELGIPINLAVVDFKIRREEKIQNLKELGFKKEKPDFTVKNPAGGVSSSLSNSLKKVLGKFSEPRTHNSEPITIKILGEEDLAVLPMIIFAPKNSTIFYGQPSKGIVYLQVNEELKKKTHKLLSQFEFK